MTFTIRRSWTDDRFCQRTGDDACSFDGLVTLERIDYQGTPFSTWTCPDCSAYHAEPLAEP